MKDHDDLKAKAEAKGYEITTIIAEGAQGQQCRFYTTWNTDHEVYYAIHAETPAAGRKLAKVLFSIQFGTAAANVRSTGLYNPIGGEHITGVELMTPSSHPVPLTGSHADDHHDHCERCGKTLKNGSAIWLELDQTTGRYLDQGQGLPEGHVSQGGFPFGPECVHKANQPVGGSAPRHCATCAHLAEPITEAPCRSCIDAQHDDHGDWSRPGWEPATERIQLVTGYWAGMRLDTRDGSGLVMQGDRLLGAVIMGYHGIPSDHDDYWNAKAVVGYGVGDSGMIDDGRTVPSVDFGGQGHAIAISDYRTPEAAFKAVCVTAKAIQAVIEVIGKEI